MKIQKHIAKKFNSNLPNKLGLSAGVKRVVLMFRINTKGVIDSINVKAPHPKLKEEFTRIIKKLPKFKPGEQKGKPVSVKYTIPIKINVEDVSKK